MSPELERFQRALLEHAERTPHAIALWGDHRQVDYATLMVEVGNRQQQLREERVKVVALALDNGVDSMLWDLAILFEELTCLASVSYTHLTLPTNREV